MQRYRIERREQAIQRGMNYIYRIACNRRNLRANGPYFVCCFPLIALTSRDNSLRRMARRMGRDIAHRWRGVTPALPADPDPSTICRFVIACRASDHWGPRDKALKEQIRQATKRFSAQEFLGFDPAIEPPPDDLPMTCGCGSENPRGRKTCQRCRKRLVMTSRYDLWTEALCATYWGERYGVTLGARFTDVIKWLPAMRPYSGRDKTDYLNYFCMVYAVTHVVYTLNDYSLYTLSPRWLPHEFEFLKANIKEAIDLEDPDMVGEFLDALRSFGLSDNNPAVRRGINFLLSRQNPDGSWGDPNTDDIFDLYHATWTAIDGLREYAWRGERLSYPKLMPLLKQWAKLR